MPKMYHPSGIDALIEEADSLGLEFDPKHSEMQDILKEMNSAKKSTRIHKGPPKKKWVGRCPDWWLKFQDGEECIARRLVVISQSVVQWPTPNGNTPFAICLTSAISECAPIEPDTSNFAWWRVKKAKPFKVPTVSVLTDGIILVTAPCIVKKGEQAYCSPQGELCDCLDPKAIKLVAHYMEDGETGQLVKLSIGSEQTSPDGVSKPKHAIVLDAPTGQAKYGIEFDGKTYTYHADPADTMEKIVEGLNEALPDGAPFVMLPNGRWAKPKLTITIGPSQLTSIAHPRHLITFKPDDSLILTFRPGQICPTCKKPHDHQIDGQPFTICKDCWDSQKAGDETQ